MDIVAKKGLIIGLIYVVYAIIVAIISEKVHGAFSILIFVGVYVAVAFQFRIKCPRCGERMGPPLFKYFLLEEKKAKKSLFLGPICTKCKEISETEDL